MKAKIYLDHHTSTFAENEALEKAVLVMKDKWGATSSPCAFGQQTIDEVNTAYQAIKELLGVGEEDSLYFASSHAEAIHAVFLSFFMHYVKETGKNHLVTTSVEEAPVFFQLKHLEQLGCASRIASVNKQGILTKEQLLEAIKPRTSLLSLSWANALTGVIQPVEEIVGICKEKALLTHVDASHVVGKLYFRFEDIGCDFMTIDGKMIHAPLGTTLILVRKGVDFSPVALGQTGLDGAGILSFKIALEKTLERFDDMTLECARLRALFEERIEEKLKEALVLFTHAPRLPNTSVIVFPKVVNELLLFLLNQEQLVASMGGGRYQKLAQLLSACQIPKDFAHAALSFSFSYDTTEKEIEEAVEILCKAYLSHERLSQGMRREG